MQPPNLITVMHQLLGEIHPLRNTLPTISDQGHIALSYTCCKQNVNVTDTILWQGHHDRVMQLNWLYFCGKCQIMPLKVWPNTALGCNHQSICMPQLQLLTILRKQLSLECYSICQYFIELRNSCNLILMFLNFLWTIEVFIFMWFF